MRAASQVVAAAAALVLATCGQGDPLTEVRPFTLEEGFTEVQVVLDVGHLELLGSALPGVRGEATLSWDEQRPLFRAYVSGGVLYLRAECPSVLQTCRGDVTAAVPRGVRVEVTLGAGDVTLRGFDGDITVDTGGGNVLVQSISGDLAVRTGVGRVDAEDLRGRTVDVDTGAGDVAAYHRGSFDLVRLHAGAGSIALGVLPGSYDCQMSAGLGREEAVGIVMDAAAGAKIVAETGRGDIRITATTSRAGGLL